MNSSLLKSMNQTDQPLTLLNPDSEEDVRCRISRTSLPEILELKLIQDCWNEDVES